MINFKKLAGLFYRALKKSTVYIIFGKKGIESSLFYRLLCLPEKITSDLGERYGERVSLICRNSFAAKYAGYKTLLIVAAVAAPFCAKCLYPMATLLLLAYYIRCIRIKGFAQKPDTIDALIYLFALLYFSFFSGFTLYTLLALICYRAISAGTKEEREKLQISFIFILSSVIAAVFGTFNEENALNTEFYILMISFSFSVANDMKPPYKGIIYCCAGLLVMIFFSLLTRGEITPAGIALCVYLCLRDLKFFVPAVIVIATVFGLFSDVIASAGCHNMIFVSGISALLISQLFYINLGRNTRKKAFVKSVIAAVCATSGAVLSGSGQNLGFVFWFVVALSLPDKKIT